MVNCTIAVSEMCEDARVYNIPERRCLDADDACGLSADGHGSLAAVSRSHCRRRVTYVQRHVLLCSVRATLGLVQLLLSLAVFVHRYCQHFLLHARAQHAVHY